MIWYALPEPLPNFDIYAYILLVRVYSSRNVHDERESATFSIEFNVLYDLWFEENTTTKEMRWTLHRAMIHVLDIICTYFAYIRRCTSTIYVVVAFYPIMLC